MTINVCGMEALHGTAYIAKRLMTSMTIDKNI